MDLVVPAQVWAVVVVAAEALPVDTAADIAAAGGTVVVGTLVAVVAVGEYMILDLVNRLGLPGIPAPLHLLDIVLGCLRYTLRLVLGLVVF